MLRPTTRHMDGPFDCIGTTPCPLSETMHNFRLLFAYTGLHGTERPAPGVHDLFNHDGLTEDGIAEAFEEFAKKEKLSFFA